MSDDDSPPPPPQSNRATFPVVLSILFVAFIAGALIGFSMCAKSYNSPDSQTGFGIFIVSAVGLVITTLVALIRLIVVVIKKVDRPPPEL